jgi:hypothetical protein
MPLKRSIQLLEEAHWLGWVIFYFFFIYLVIYSFIYLFIYLFIIYLLFIYSFIYLFIIYLFIICFICTFFLAPELFVEHPKASKESDIYSFGVVCFEIANRTFPWANISSTVIPLKVTQGIFSFYFCYV